MPINLASPGIVVREVDLTIGRVDSATDKTAALVAPFEKGPVNIPILIENEQDLIDNFGQPYDTDDQVETWMVASSYLAYGGRLSVVRAGVNGGANAGTSGTTIINSVDDYINKGYDENTLPGKVFVARNPGSWANGLKVAVIDGFADQTLGINTSGVSAFSASISNRSGTITGSASTIGIATASVTIGQEVICDVSGIVAAGTTVTNIGAGVITISSASLSSVDVTTTFDFGTTTFTSAPLQVGMGITQAVPPDTIKPGAGTTDTLDGVYKGIITGIGKSTVDVKFLSHTPNGGTELFVDYESSGVYKFSKTGNVAIHTSGQTVAFGTTEITSTTDWFDSQSITLSNGSVLNWNQIADRPTTSAYAAARNSRFDVVHVVVIDDKGKVTGNAGTILEKHLNLSKAKDAEFSAGSPSYWRKFILNASDNVFALDGPAAPVTTGFKKTGSGFDHVTDKEWDQNADGIIFGANGNVAVAMTGGLNYGGTSVISSTNALKASLGNLTKGYDLFTNKEEFDIDFLLMGSSAGLKTAETQALANKIISVAEIRKDAVAFISPHKSTFISGAGTDNADLKSSADITNNVIEFYAPITSSTYAIFDSGHKYMFDRFSSTFRYIPLNGDIAGTCARNDINNFPWFSPAGTARGAILNAVKLAYNPNQVQRDKLYTNRINPVIFSPGAGIVLFGDKTGTGKASAFDRINVRRLFIFIENAIEAAAKDQLFEFNDEITRTNFVNIVEPFLRDVQAKRGITDFRVVCDETNNTAAVIDNNEFVADIFIKPARSINFIGLTFVATRTGISFEEVIGTV